MTSKSSSQGTILPIIDSQRGKKLHSIFSIKVLPYLQMCKILK